MTARTRRTIHSAIVLVLIALATYGLGRVALFIVFRR